MKFFRSLSVSLSLSRALKKSSKNAQKDGKKSSLNFLSLSLSFLRFRCCVVLLETRRCFTRENFIFAIVFLFFLVQKTARFWLKKTLDSRAFE